VELARIAEESAKGSFSLMLATAASTVIGAVVVIVIARLLGPSGYGLYSLAFVLPSLFVSVADLGVSPSLTRFSASLSSRREYVRLARMMDSGLILAVLASLASYLLSVRFAGPLGGFVLQRQDMAYLLSVASVVIVFQEIFTLAYNTLVGLDHMGQSALMTVLRDLVRLILSPVLIIVGFGVAGAIAGQVSGWAMAAALGLCLMLVHRRVLSTTPSDRSSENGLQENIKTMMVYGLPLYAGTLLGTILSQYQTIALAFFTTDAEIGNFRAAINFGSLIGVVATPVVTALFPAFSKLDLETRKEDLRRLFEYSVKYTTLLILPAAVVIAALSKDLIRVVYGSAYGLASTYLALYVGTFLLAGLGSQVVGSFLNGVGRTKDTLKITAVQLGIFLPTAPLMAWLFRVPGLIIALILSGLVSISYGLWLSTVRYGMRVDLKSSFAALVAALASALPVLLIVYYSVLPSLANVIIGGLLYLLAYLTLAPLFGAVKRTDLQTLAPILGQIRILRPPTSMVFEYMLRVLDVLDSRKRT